ncbi:uncharacterized protein UDID_05004 [Ustilago sp. UG-2017a]|nr:uncharacterized protein UDID_05004 [Ustilago sp. UG-2017a]
MVQVKKWGVQLTHQAGQRETFADLARCKNAGIHRHDKHQTALVNEGTCHQPSSFFTPAQPVPFGAGSETMSVNLPVEFTVTIAWLGSEDRPQLQAELLGKRSEALNIHQCAEASIGASIYTSLKSTTGPEPKVNSSGCR